MSDLFHAFKSLFHEVTCLVCSWVYAPVCVYTHTHSLKQILCCKTFRDNGECKNECTTWYYWIPACTMLKTTAHQRILFLDKIIHISSHIIPITDISFDNNIALKTHFFNLWSLQHTHFTKYNTLHIPHSNICTHNYWKLHSQVTLPYSLKHSYHWEILQIKVKDNKVNHPDDADTESLWNTDYYLHSHMANQPKTHSHTQLLTLHSQVTLPYSLKHSYHWEILQIKVKDNNVNHPDDADTESLWNTDYYLHSHMANQPKTLHCVQHPWKLEGGGEDKDNHKFLLPLLAFIVYNIETLDIHNNNSTRFLFAKCWPHSISESENKVTHCSSTHH
jgi:hypothetical protein